MNKQEARRVLTSYGFGNLKWEKERHYYKKVYVRYELLAEELEAIRVLIESEEK